MPLRFKATIGTLAQATKGAASSPALGLRRPPVPLEKELRPLSFPAVSRCIFAHASKRLEIGVICQICG
jgi:hypothetical protein